MGGDPRSLLQRLKAQEELSQEQQSLLNNKKVLWTPY